MLKYVIQKPDLDTCLTGLILGAKRGSVVAVVVNGALPCDLSDGRVACIEAGGSGQVHLNNFDHHAPEENLPSACAQAWVMTPMRSTALGRLVDYVDKVDRGIPLEREIPFPSLSALFSGMLIALPGARQRFFAGIDLLTVVLARSHDPLETMLVDKCWQPYADAARMNRERLARDFGCIRRIRTDGGLMLGFLRTRNFGGAWAIYDQNCDIALKYHPAFGAPPVPKFTISSKGIPLTALAEELNRIDPGWGGRKEIIGSPRIGSTLGPGQVIDTIIRCC